MDNSEASGRKVGSLTELGIKYDAMALEALDKTANLLIEKGATFEELEAVLAPHRTEMAKTKADLLRWAEEECGLK